MVLLLIPMMLGVFAPLLILIWSSHAVLTLQILTRSVTDLTISIGVSLQTGKLSTAIAVGISWTETYIQASLIFSWKKGRYFFSINFKLAIKHWLVLAAAALCYLIPALTPVAGYGVKVLCASARTAKPILCSMLPILLKA